MSGLFGMVDFAASPHRAGDFRSIAESASYRAPGGIGYRFLGAAGFAHLALHSGATGLDQPLLDARGQVCVVLDGRLDNRSELIAPSSSRPRDRPPLMWGCCSLPTLEWGVACTDHLLGDFAFAVWDAGRQSPSLRRRSPRHQAAPLRPYRLARVLRLGCHTGSLHPAVPDGYNEVEIAAYLASQFEDPERSFFAAVRKLAPGQRLIAENGQLRVERYWSPEPQEIRYSRDEDYAAHFLELFQRAVTDRLR